jgi:hypothetical protein
MPNQGTAVASVHWGTQESQTMTGPKLCAQCKNPDEPLTNENGGSISKWIDGKKLDVAFVHRKCADKWAEENGGTIFEAIVP